MPAGDVETYHADGKWRNRIVGGSDLPGDHVTREAAFEVGRGEARERQVGHIVIGLDGIIEDRNSYEDEPRAVSG